MQHHSPPSLDDLDHCLRLVGAERWEELREKRLFVTGGTGFIGKWLLTTLAHAERALKLGCQVTVLTRNPANFEVITRISNGGSMMTALAGEVRSFKSSDHFDFVVHAAADVATTPSPWEIFDTCVRGTERVLELATRSHASKMLLVSSGAVYGQQPCHMERMSESYLGAPSTLSLQTGYAQGKRAAEWLTMLHASQGSFRATIARCFAFVGPFLPLDRHFAIGNFMHDALCGQPIHVHGDGTSIRSYMHAADLAAWLWTILISGETGHAYNVGGVEPISIFELACRVAKICANSQGVVVKQAPPPGRLAERYVPDVMKARGAFNLPEPLGLDLSIQRTIRWLKA